MALKLIDILKNIDINTEGVDTHDNQQIYEIYLDEPDRAITLILKQNKGYYIEIMKGYTDIEEDFIIGALFDSIKEAFQDYPHDRVSKNYVKISGTIFKHKLINKTKYNKANKRTLDYKNTDTISRSEMEEIGQQINSNHFDSLQGKLDPFKKIELEDEIKRSNLKGIQKKILLMIIETEGRVNYSDIADNFGFSKQNVSYHIQEIKDKIDIL